MDSRFSSSPLLAKPIHDLRTVKRAASSISAAPWKANLASALCRWYAAFHSFRGHIRIQSAKETARVDLGPSVQLCDGRYQANTRTLARAEGIRRLQAIHQWVDNADLHIFLMGFEAGEEYSKTHCHLRGNLAQRNADV